ncbi:Bug family tripartite tricarboxylate transporter substrate binding protein [Variovorax saccharolyticus]|uniref:Bug family tripartite tricarboxylate transporter substrate binding protein n=1 Tax=Variovorax saccharolyticus TaxID=3053516 RepID=UPI002577F890|nr:tripartite tricarboxylate transporter substrate-binding protein [Variovorax sp. J22R187]MDM0022206.1 tripartite tricarboxylate transporter substrate-binding protein [Variovorax sp. J22R187]
MKNLFSRLIAIAGLLCVAVSLPAAAQDYPDRPIQLVIPYAAGGITDALGRLVAENLSNRLGQRIVPDNRPGAGTAIGAAAVARATPNGYTLLFSTLAHSLNATMSAALPFDSVNDFAFVGKVGQIQLLIMTNPQHVKVDNLGGLVALMRSANGNVSYASSGIGTPSHLGVELLKRVAHGEAVHVPYRGESPGLSDLMGGQVSFMLCSIATCVPRLQDGKLKALALTATSRSALAPTVPTVGEAGFPGSEINTWYFIAAPKGTPTAVVNRLNSALNEVLADESFKSRVLAMGVELESRTSPAATKGLVQSEIEKWRPIVKASGATSN